MRLFRWLPTLLLCVAFALPAQAARRGARFLARGIALYNAARFRQSLATLKRARRYAKKPETRARINLYIGLDESVLGAKDKAVLAFREALIDDPTIELDEARFKPADIALFKRAHAGLRGSVRVSATNGDGATVQIDGRPRGKVPLTLTLPIGKHLVVIRRDETEQRREIIVRNSSTLELALIFAPRTTRPKPAGPVKPVHPMTTPDPPPLTTPRPPRSAWSFSHSRLWTWIALGTAAAAGGAALGVGLAARSDAEEYRTTQDPTKLQSLKDGATSKMLVSNVLAGVAGAAAIGAVVLYYFEGRGGVQRAEHRDAAARRREASLADRLQIGPTGVRLSF